MKLYFCSTESCDMLPCPGARSMTYLYKLRLLRSEAPCLSLALVKINTVLCSTIIS